MSIRRSPPSVWDTKCQFLWHPVPPLMTGCEVGFALADLPARCLGLPCKPWVVGSWSTVSVRSSTWFANSSVYVGLSPVTSMEDWSDQEQGQQGVVDGTEVFKQAAAWDLGHIQRSPPDSRQCLPNCNPQGCGFASGRHQGESCCENRKSPKDLTLPSPDRLRYDGVISEVMEMRPLQLTVVIATVLSVLVGLGCDGGEDDPSEGTTGVECTPGEQVCGETELGGNHAVLECIIVEGGTPHKDWSVIEQCGEDESCNPNTLSCETASSGDPGEIMTMPDIVSSNDKNHPPVLALIGNHEVLVGEDLIIELQAEDEDADLLTFSVYGDIPSNSTFDKSKGLFLWSPTEPGGFYFVTFVVSDGGAFDSETVELRSVNALGNQAPLFKPVEEQFLKVGLLFKLKIEASDPDGDPLSFEAVGELPSTAYFDSEVAEFLWTPESEYAGTVQNVLFAVSDGFLMDELDVKLIVEDDLSNNHPPEVDPMPPFEVQVGELLQVEVKASDPDGDELAYGDYGDLPDGAAFDSTSHIFSWTPAPSYAGKLVLVQLAVSDGIFVVQAQLTIQVL